MTRRLLPALLLAAACSSDPAGPEIEGLCLAFVQLDGILFVHQGEFVATHAEPTEVVGTVARNIGCDDTPTGLDSTPVVQDGDSNFLEAGTALYVVPGFDPAQRIAARPGDSWLLLVAQEG